MNATPHPFNKDMDDAANYRGSDKGGGVSPDCNQASKTMPWWTSDKIE
jgi:hypothetical protein